MALVGIALDDAYSLSIMMNCYFNMKQTVLGLSVFGKFVKLGFQPTAITYNTLMNGFVVNNQVPEAERIFTKYFEAGQCEPTVVSFTILIKGLCKVGNNSAAVCLLTKMHQNGFAPNTVSYNTVIDGLCKSSEIDEASRLFREMIDRGVIPDVYTYTSLIQGLCVEGLHFQVSVLWTEMVRQGVKLNVFTFSAMIDSLCKEKKVKEAQALLGMMIIGGQQPNVVTFNSLIYGFCLLREMERAKKLFGQLVEKGSIVNVRTCNIMIHGYCQTKEVDLAYQIFMYMNCYEIFKNMTCWALVPDTITYNTMIDGLYKAGRMGEAQKLTSEMRERGLPQDLQTFNIILHGLCTNNQLSAAVEMLRGMEADNTVDIVTYNTIIEALCKAGDMECAMHFFSDLSLKGVRPDGFTYNMLIRGFIHKNEGSKAYNLVMEMLKRGYSGEQMTLDLIQLKVKDGSIKDFYLLPMMLKSL
uniref:pentatricopeptide repeat-containing protein At1g62670, mitochondrial-like n=1 Tax=Fragaria vesca subsp. vesca TaxID=101020 RepID=UPI0005CA47C9|nr:PREDICTED: pentatricopeptide repeat-containing protein At1g62670, mitochondrial-like [Fragaria vesca subsp. vesca]